MHLPPSDPDYQSIAEMTQLLAILKNPHMHRLSLPELERQAAIAEIENALADELQASAFRLFIGDMAL